MLKLVFFLELCARKFHFLKLVLVKSRVASFLLMFIIFLNLRRLRAVKLFIIRVYKVSLTFLQLFLHMFFNIESITGILPAFLLFDFCRFSYRLFRLLRIDLILLRDGCGYYFTLQLITLGGRPYALSLLQLCSCLST